MADVKVVFHLISLRPDQRQYRNQAMELQHVSDERLGLPIEVTVPLEHGLIANSELIIQAQLAGNAQPDPVLTIAGLKYVQDQFDVVFLHVEETKVETTDDENWGDDLPPSKPAPAKPAAKVEEEDWDTDTKKPDEVPWDESTEEWN